MNGVDRRWNLASAIRSQMLRIRPPTDPSTRSALGIIEGMDVDEDFEYSIVLAVAGRVGRVAFVHSYLSDHVERLAEKLREGYLAIGYLTYISPEPETLEITALPPFETDAGVLGVLNTLANEMAELFMGSGGGALETLQIQSRIAAERRAA